MTEPAVESGPLTERQRYWQTHLQRCKANGQSLRAYADEHGLKVSTLYFYRKRLRGGNPLPVAGSKKATFVRAQVASTTLPCRVHLRNGVTAEFGIGDAQLPSLLAALNTLS